MPIEITVMAAIGFFVHRDATRRAARFGSPPGGTSARTWAAMCGLVWLPLVGYVQQRRRQDQSAPSAHGSAVRHGWWMVLTAVAAAWWVTDLIKGNAPGIVERGVFTVIVLGTWWWASMTSGAAEGSWTSSAGREGQHDRSSAAR